MVWNSVYNWKGNKVNFFLRKSFVVNRLHILFISVLMSKCQKNNPINPAPIQKTVKRISTHLKSLISTITRRFSDPEFGNWTGHPNRTNFQHLKIPNRNLCLLFHRYQKVRHKYSKDQHIWRWKNPVRNRVRVQPEGQANRPDLAIPDRLLGSGKAQIRPLQHRLVSDRFMRLNLNSLWLLPQGIHTKLF